MQSQQVRLSYNQMSLLSNELPTLLSMFVSEQRYTQIDALLSPFVPSSSTSDPQSQVAKKGLINQQDVNGQTPLHILLSNRQERDVRIDHVTPLLQLGADGLMAAINRTTPLDMAAKKWGEKQADQDILRLVVKKIILDRLVHAIANNQVRPFNPTENYSDIAATSTETPTDDNLTRKLCIVFERYNITTDILQAIIDSLQVGGAQNQPTIQYHMDLLQAYIHVNNLSIDRETLGNFNIHFRALNGKNLLQLAGDRRNPRLVSCICNRIYTPWTLRHLSRASDAEWGDPMYETLQHNDEIKQTIDTRYWGLCLFLGGAALTTLTTVGLVARSAIGAYLAGLILQRLYPN